MNLNQIVIVGSGQGGFQMAASLRQDGFTGKITLIGDEPGVPYQRPPLSKGYMKEGNADKLALRPAAFYDQNDIDLIEATRVTQIDRDEKTVQLNDGRVVSYDHLILATGSRNATPPIKNLDLSGVLALRTLADAKSIRESVPDMRHAIVVGGGFIGLEFAAVARAAGVGVTVVEGAPRFMARAVSEPVSTFFQDAHKGWGSDVVLGQFVSEVLDDGQGRACGIRLADGTEIKGDTVLIAAGVVPNSELAADAGLHVSNGVEVDAFLATSDPDISALGDCCLFPEPISGTVARLESVQAATDHARTISKRLMGAPEPYAAVPWFWSDQGDKKLQIAGLNTGADDIHVVPSNEGTLVVLSFRAGDLISVETVNAAAAHMSARKLLGMGDPITKDALAAVDYDLRAYLKALK